MVLGLDPGETTGVAKMCGAELIEATQWDTKDLALAAKQLNGYLLNNAVDYVACEDYRVYAWESEKHKWAALHTPKLIGVIIAVCWYANVPVKLRMAISAKQFVTDEKLMDWGLWKKGQRHARDAIRHCVYHQIFGPKAG